jgi:hypothetical protein
MRAVRRRVFLVGVCVLFALLGGACAAEAVRPTSTKSVGSPPVYRVIHETGLYPSSRNMNAVQLATLPVGILLKPADGRATLLCDSFTDSGIPFTLCHVETLTTGVKGWVLMQWIERQ